MAAAEAMLLCNSEAWAFRQPASPSLLRACVNLVPQLHNTRIDGALAVVPKHLGHGLAAVEQSGQGGTALATGRGRGGGGGRGKPVIDDLQIVVGGWDKARRGEVEQEVRHLFGEIDAKALLHNIHIPLVRTRFARIEP